MRFLHPTGGYATKMSCSQHVIAHARGDMFEETGWMCPQCGHFNTRPTVCEACGESLERPLVPIDRFGRRVREEEVARVVSIIANPPNLRDSPEEGDITGDYHAWFDGGAVRYDTGSKTYSFADGTTAWVVAPAPWLRIEMELPSGERVVVAQVERSG